MDAPKATSKGALAGVRVIDLSRLLPGPYCSMVLADHGAEVIAIEGKRFAADNLYIEDLYRNKRHMTLNLKSQEGVEIFYQLVADADVVIEGFRPGVAAKLGVDYQAVKAINSSIIYCSITGYGQDGPLRDEAGHDVNYLSRSGVLSLMGEGGRPPAIPAVQVADIMGAMNGVTGILLALNAKRTTGRGQYIDISMSDGMLALLTMPTYLSQTRGMEPRRGDSLLSHRYGCYNTYETADGKYLALGAVEARFWKTFCGVINREHYAELQYDDDHREKIVADLRSMFLAETLAHWLEFFRDKDVCLSAVKEVEEVAGDPLFGDRQMVVSRERQGIFGHTYGIAVKLSATPGSIRSQPPGFGASTFSVLQELGYSAEDYATMSAQGII